MKRVTLLKPATEPVNPAWTQAVYDALCSEERDELLRLMRAPEAAAGIRHGLRIAETQNVPFAELCMHLGDASSLGAVLDARIPGIGWAEVCTAVSYADANPNGLTVEHPICVHQKAVDNSAPEFLALALRYEPDVDKAAGTLHRRAVERLQPVAGFGSLGTFKRAVECCRLLLNSHSPSKLGDAYAITQLLLNTHWRSADVEDALAPLVIDRLHAGLLRFAPSDPRYEKRCYLSMTMAGGNVRLVELGLDNGLDVEHELHVVGKPDLWAMADACARVYQRSAIQAMLTARQMRLHLDEPSHVVPSRRIGHGARNL